MSDFQKSVVQKCNESILLQSNTVISHHWSCDIKQHYSYSRVLLVITKCFFCVFRNLSNDMNDAIKYFLPGFSRTSGWLYITNFALTEWEQGALLGTTMLWCWWSHRLWRVHWCHKDLWIWAEPWLSPSRTKREACVLNNSWVIHNQHKAWGQWMWSATADMWFWPTQRLHEMRWDYGSHERLHNSRVTFELHGIKSLWGVRIQFSQEVVQGWRPDLSNGLQKYFHDNKQQKQLLKVSLFTFFISGFAKVALSPSPFV